MPDGIHGAVISWTDFRTSSATQIDVFAKRIDVGGPAAVDPWPAFGFRLARAPQSRAPFGHGGSRARRGHAGHGPRLRDRGQPVRTLALDRAYAAGAHALSWDGRDESGAPAPGGIYLVRVTAGGRSLTRTLALLRQRSRYTSAARSSAARPRTRRAPRRRTRRRATARRDRRDRPTRSRDRRPRAHAPQ